eukprot:TRINITY_DN10853_c0_g1_i1.p1 TRINITY_DN10853_c0_g1~~TRINITY_DN10853_c0_g1_i1.p1  ORF type:complete len:692 (+),score=109.89 TRINITY_DN10853_c0_g1_i1:943-3018(+)
MVQLSPQDLGTTAWSFATIAFKDEPLLRLIAQSAIDKISEFCAQGLSNSVWAFATLEFNNKPWMESISMRASSIIEDFGSQELSNTTWAFATLEFLEESLLKGIAAASLRNMEESTTQSIANTGWAFAKLGVLDTPLMQALSKFVVFKIRAATAQDLSNTVWAFAVQSFQDRSLFEAISQEFFNKRGQFTPQNLANMCWAFATTQILNPPMVHALAAESMSKIHEFGHQQISNTAWSLATLALVNLPLLDALSNAARRCQFQFDAQGISNLAWSCAMLLYYPSEELLAVLSEAAIQKQLDFGPQNCANVVWSYAMLVVLDMPLIDSMAACSIEVIQEFSSQCLANTAWAFANLGVMNLPLFDAISTAAQAVAANFSIHTSARADLIAFAKSILGILWAQAFSEVGNDELSARFLATLKEVGNELDRLALTQALHQERDNGRNAFDAGPWSRNLLTKPPMLVTNLRGIVVVHKPPNWEVDGKARAANEEEDYAATDSNSVSTVAPLSSWLQNTLDPRTCPVPWHPDMDYGFLHRLDVPSSGLVLCGTTFEGLMMLRWQLDTYRIERQYVVFGHGLAPSELRKVTANIDPVTISSRKSFVSEEHGKPATSLLKALMHMRLPKAEARSTNAWHAVFSAFGIRIHTGRRHQIRAHLLHSGFPTVVDCKYASKSVALYSLNHDEQAYLGRKGSQNS